MEAEATLPPFLKSFDSFREHLDSQLEGSSNAQKGESFLKFALKLLPMADLWGGFGPPEANPKKSHDGGVDFTAKHEDGFTTLVGQSKYRITRREDFDNVVSKFADYHQKKLGTGQASLFNNSEARAPRMKFLVVTSTHLQGIVDQYERSSLPSKSFYDKLKGDDTLELVNGTDLFNLLGSLYRRSFIIPTEVELRCDVAFVSAGGVYLSIVDGAELRELHRIHGASLFFENIRDFLGFGSDSSAGRDSVNDEILATLRESPEQMLARNNGVTFKATKVAVVSDKVLRLKECGIVNGCQTTMCLSKANPPRGVTKVVVKIVESDDSWDIAKAANYQNSVTRLDLDLARYLRPQLVSKVATTAGFGMKATETEHVTVAQALDSIHRNRVSYEEMKLLYLGFFSRSPNNLFASNYSELRDDVLAEVYEEGRSEDVMRILFGLLSRMRGTVEQMRETFKNPNFSELFQRFYRDSNSKYRCFLAILSASVCLDDWLGNKAPDTRAEYERIIGFLNRLDVILTTKPDLFDRVFLFSFITVAGIVLDSQAEGDSEILQRMHHHISRANFQQLFRQVLLRISTDDPVMALMQEARELFAESGSA